MALVAAEVKGAPCWLSLTTRDLEAAERFYAGVLGWSFRPGSFGRAFSVAELDGVPVAGLGAVAEQFAVAVAWVPYFSVDDADEAVARIRGRGGTVGVGPVSYPPRGRAALAADLEGAVFGIWEGLVLPQWRTGTGPPSAWLELHTRNAFDAALFYGDVLRWAGGEGCCEPAYEDDRVVLRHQGEALAALNSGPVEAGAEEAQQRPRWLVHFRVDDLAAARAAALRLGGSVATGAEWGAAVDEQLTLRDPDGALFTLDRAPWR
ncbi:VOC family protein [Streptomyces sp. RerS4]|uniref:VOC family protein n=1 Tax=Streptomyces sp. RerS4 TaxID=2942449 RepID=UPI00201CA8B0|nr:VOC family protein [Streptomyces sp. RerS4]UQW99635.1 VOC family protein [Streptomyces sp. RerS4]